MKILQVGYDNWADQVETLPEDLEWLFCQPDQVGSFLQEQESLLLRQAIDKLDPKDDMQEVPKVRVQFKGIIITSPASEKDLLPLMSTIEAYGLFTIPEVQLESTDQFGFFRRKMLRTLDHDGSVEERLSFLYLNLFPSQYGAKLKLSDVAVNPQFSGQVNRNGNVDIRFQGDFGEDYRQLFTFRYNLSSFPVALELWQEYSKLAGDCSIRLEVTPMWNGSLYSMMTPLIFEEEDMREPFILESNPDEIGFYTVSILAKGQGTLSFGPLHWRYSRMGLGRFVLGGERVPDARRQEFIYYFNPGDMKPPLNVYFSGYRGAEGFEGFGMMKQLKAPFMLIGDPRLEGGSFYIGSEDYEKQLVQVIQDSLDYLGFEKSDLILSGLSMGTYGALYYAPDFDPYALVIGKPFTNLGDTVDRLKLKRPDEFETSADILLNTTGGLSQEDMDKLNQKFWDKFSQSRFPNTQFAVAYMKNDDYDGLATERLIDALSKQGSHIYTAGYEGRHNDNSPVINKWFKKQYRQLLESKYGRNFSK